MTEILLVVLIVAVIGVAVLVVRANTSTDTQEVEDLRRTLDQIVREQTLLTNTVETYGKQQAVSSDALKDSMNPSQVKLSAAVTQRLETVQEKMGTSLTDSAKATAASLGELSQRLETIDKAQANITNLSEQVVSLQHVLDDKHARGAFGEVQLNDIVLDRLV